MVVMPIKMSKRLQRGVPAKVLLQMAIDELQLQYVTLVVERNGRTSTEREYARMIPAIISLMKKAQEKRLRNVPEIDADAIAIAKAILGVNGVRVK